ncbi:hypothetical protein ACFYNF_33990 [Streptomyces sp. NPDC006641]|uniref:hypothetical protein n=1 Tax=unclassified Streptomyces TaxID=2593676 RepID=UPI0036781B5F
MGAAKLAAAVYVTDPDTNETVILEAGTSPEARLAALVTNPAAWEDGNLPTTTPAEPAPTGDDEADTEPAARKTAAKKPARGRTAAAEGTSGQ